MLEFLRPSGQSVAVLGTALGDNLLNKSCIDVLEAEYGLGNRFQKVER